MMIAQGLFCPTLPTSDMARSRRFYEEALGLKEFPDAPEGGVWYAAGGGSLLHVYESTVGPGKHTAVTILIEDFEQTIAEMRSRGVVLEEYDLPGLKTEDGVWRSDSGFLAAWIKDPDENLLGLESHPRGSTGG
jgi:catechol 2,3-dioxygenase-like lactoylglutathione lyase family enzyme